MEITNIWVGTVLVVLAVTLAVGVSILLRRRAPWGGFFSDSERAATIFSAIGTMFSVLLALVILLSVETYTQTKSHANAEADAVLEQFQLARLFPSGHQYETQSQLICYSRSVISEWPLVSNGEQHPVVDDWAQSLNTTIDSVAVEGGKAESGFELFLQQSLQRQEERRGRLEGADGTLPSTVWPILILGAASVLIYMLYYADKGERLMSQALQVGLVTALLGSSLILINALDHPFSTSPGKITPDKMQNSLRIMEGGLAESIDSNFLEAALPCNREGSPNPTNPPTRSFPQTSTMAEIIARGKLVIGVSYNIALFGQLDPVSGVVSGFDADLGREIAKAMGLREDQIEFRDLLVEERIPALQSGEVDMVIVVMTITPGREEQVEFSRPYYLAGQSILVQRDARTVSSLRDLGGRRVCVPTESTSEETLMEVAPGVELVYRETLPACVAALKDDEVDAMSTDDIILAGFAADDDELVLVGGQFTQEPYGVALPDGDVEFAAFIDGVIEEMIGDGRWGKLYYQYLGDIPGLASVDEAKRNLPSGE